MQSPTNPIIVRFDLDILFCGISIAKDLDTLDEYGVNISNHAVFFVHLEDGSMVLFVMTRDESSIKGTEALGDLKVFWIGTTSHDWFKLETILTVPWIGNVNKTLYRLDGMIYLRFKSFKISDELMGSRKFV